MKIALFGATGVVGKALVKEAIKRGFEVKVLARNPDKLGKLAESVEVIQGDYFNSDDQIKVLKDTQVVFSTIGPPIVRKGGPQPSEYENAMRSLIKNIESIGLNRFINVAGAASSVSGEHIQLSRKIIRFLMKLTVPNITPAKELEIKALQDSNLNFTTTRPPMIVDKDLGKPAIASCENLPAMKLEANQLAQFMLDAVNEKKWFRKLPFIATK